MPTPSHLGRLAGLCLFLAALSILVVGCGSLTESKSADVTVAQPTAQPIEWAYPPRPIAGLRQKTVGAGPRAAVVLWDAHRRRPPRDVVVFLHGYEPLPPWTYGDWLRHLANAGDAIVYPVYQGPATPPGRYRAGAIDGIAAGLRVARARHRSVVAIGVNTGGAVAFDYAAVARSEDLAPPRAVAAIYPARNPPDGTVTPADLAAIPPRTHLLVIAGPGDPIPAAEAQARALLAGAHRVPSRFRRLDRPVHAGRYSPQENDDRARLSFWRPVDQLIATTRAGGR
jgi:hypothetical protein